MSFILANDMEFRSARDFEGLYLNTISSILCCSVGHCYNFILANAEDFISRRGRSGQQTVKFPDNANYVDIMHDIQIERHACYKRSYVHL